MCRGFLGALGRPWGHCEVAGEFPGEPCGRILEFLVTFEVNYQTFLFLPFLFCILRNRKGKQGHWRSLGALACPSGLRLIPGASLGGSKASLGIRCFGHQLLCRHFWGGHRATAFIDTGQRTSGSGPWPPLSYKLKLLPQREISRSEMCPSLPGSSASLSCSPCECTNIYIHTCTYMCLHACIHL